VCRDGVRNPISETTSISTTVARSVRAIVAAALASSTTNKKADYGILQARQLLIEFIGGEPGEQMRGQFA
jgi:hypothetical protein